MKKLLKSILVVTMLLCMSLSSVSALGSISKPGTIGEWDGDNANKEEYELVWNELEVQDVNRFDANLRNEMKKVNYGEKSIKDYLTQVGLSGSFPKNTTSVILIQEIRDLLYRNKETKEYKYITNVTVTWEVPTLVEGMGDIYIYHYDETAKRHELFKPLSVNYANKTVTVKFDDLCPVGVVAIKSTKKPVDTSAVGFGSIFGIIAMGAGAFYVLNNKKED